MPKLKPLSGLDASFLYLEAAGTPMHEGSLMLLARPAGRRDFHRDLSAHLGERLPRAKALRRVLQEAPLDLGHPLWRETDAVDLEAHVLRRKLPGKGTQAQLDALVGKLHAQMLDRERPLWQFVVIEGLASGEIALYSKIHHAVLDGQGGVALAQALLDLEPSSPRKRGPSDVQAVRKSLDSRVRGNDGIKTTLRANLRQLVQALRAVPPTIKIATAKSDVTWRQRLERLRDALLLAPRTPFNAQCSGERTFASASLSLDAVKRAAKAHSASLNDVVLAVCASVLRDHLQRSGGLPRKPLIAAMPVSLRSRDDAEVNNQVSMVQCPLPTDVDDPHARLRAITATTLGIKRSVGEFRHLIPTDYPGLGAPKWAPGLSRLWAKSRLAERLPPLANVAISNVPGPPVPLFLAGAAVHHIFPVSIVTHGLGLNITVQTYAGMLEFGITACRQALPRPLALAKALQPALDELLAPLDE
jgi:WS/DGAT/MGAT family acyltransferase